MAFFPKSAALTEKVQSLKNEIKTENTVSEENLRERRYLWTARAFAMVFITAFITNILMLMSLFSLVPLVRVQPYELSFSDKNAQTVTIQPFEINEKLLNGISASMVRQYVTLRKTIRQIQMKWLIVGEQTDRLICCQRAIRSKFLLAKPAKF